METCKQFGEFPTDLAEKVKYAKWRFVEIAKATKEGRAPAPPRGTESLESPESEAVGAGYPDYMALPPAESSYPEAPPTYDECPPMAELPGAPPSVPKDPSIPSPPALTPHVERPQQLPEPTPGYKPNR